MRAWSHSRLTFPLGKRTRYPLSKYALLRARVVAEGIVAEVGEPEEVAWAAVGRTHDPAFAARMRAGELSVREERVLGLPWSEQLVGRTLAGVGGTLAAAGDALEHGVGVMLGGGTHHAGHASARGYCMFNELPAGTTDEAYLAALDRALTEALQRFPDPDLVFYVAGADPWEGDALGRLALTKPGLRARDDLVLDRLAAHPTVITLAGGYAPDVHDTVAIHAQTIAAAAAAHAKRGATSSA